MVLRLGTAKVKVALALSLCVRRFCAKSINAENGPRSGAHAPTLRRCSSGFSLHPYSAVCGVACRRPRGPFVFDCLERNTDRDGSIRATVWICAFPLPLAFSLFSAPGGTFVVTTKMRHNQIKRSQMIKRVQPLSLGHNVCVYCLF